MRHTSVKETVAHCVFSALATVIINAIVLCCEPAVQVHAWFIYKCVGYFHWRCENGGNHFIAMFGHKVGLNIALKSFVW